MLIPPLTSEPTELSMTDSDGTLDICKAIKSNRHAFFYVGNNTIIRVKTTPRILEVDFTFKDVEVESVERFKRKESRSISEVIFRKTFFKLKALSYMNELMYNLVTWSDRSVALSEITFLESDPEV